MYLVKRTSHSWLVILATTILSTHLAARADMTDATYREAAADSATKLTVQMYVAGVGAGYEWANAQLQRLTQPQLYCQPEKLGLNATNYVNIVDQQLKRRDEMKAKGIVPKNSSTYVELELLMGLQATFPCPAR